MNKSERQPIFYRIGDINENHCQDCEWNSRIDSKDKLCRTCVFGIELRELGKKLDEPRKGLKKNIYSHKKGDRK